MQQQNRGISDGKTAARLQPRRLVLTGSILVDVLMYVDRLPERGGDLVARQSLVTSGGGFNVLVGAARLGMPAAYAGRVGDGTMGTQVMIDLRASNIPVLLPRSIGEDTGFDIGFVEPDGERTFATSPGVEARLSLADLRSIPLRDGDALYVSGYDLCYPVSGAALANWLPTLSRNCLLVIDPGPLAAAIPADRLQPVLHRCDILSLSAREASLLTGETNIQLAALRLAPLIASGGFVVARDGSRGCWLASSTLAPVHIPARPTHVVDSTGAGDAHVAALLAHLALGDDILAAARIANVAASLSVEKTGPATGPTASELAAALAIHRI